ncbi:unnamed protein product [Arabidopsis lyrata]|nr:unnamed protein product [Arabidopsis lyrata]
MDDLRFPYEGSSHGVRQIDHGNFWKSSRNQNGGNLRKEESIVTF